jgi:ankyrin repeat protein
LCEKDIFLDSLDSSGRSALFIALKSGSHNVVSHLQEKGATAIASDQKWAKILCIVGFEGDLLKLKLLHRCEVNLEISDYDLRHVAHLAACEGHVAVL